MQKATASIMAVWIRICGVRGLLKELKIMQGRVILRIRSTSFFLVSWSMRCIFMQYIPTAI